MWILFFSSDENCSAFTSFLLCWIFILLNSLFWNSHESLANDCLQPGGNAFVSQKISPDFFAWTGNFLFLNVMNFSSFRFTFFQTDLRLLYRPSFLWRLLPKNLLAQNHTIWLHWCNNSNSNPLVCASRESNQDAALFVLHHFNLCGIVLGSFVSYRGVIIVATMGLTDVKRHVCRFLVWFRVRLRWDLFHKMDW